MNGNGEKEMGVALLGSTAAFGIWSSCNPSYFTINRFGVREGNKDDAKDIRFGMLVGLVLTGLTAGAIWALYGDKGKMPAAVTAGTGLALYGSYEYILRRNGR